MTRCVNIGYNRCMSHDEKIRALLCDLDGTLVDTSGDIAYALNTALAVEGVAPLDERSCMRFVGRGLRNTLLGALLAAGVHPDGERLDHVLEVFENTYAEHPHDRSQIYPGIPEFLRKCIAAQLAVGVLSNKEDSLVHAIVGHLFPRVPFTSVRGASEAFPLKPDPGSALDFAAMAGCEPSEVLYVGDSGIDRETAMAAGMRLAVVTWGFSNREALESAGCNPLVDTVDELAREVFPWT